MHKMAEELIKCGIIDSYLTKFSIGDWYDQVIIEFDNETENKHTNIRCSFLNCFEIDFKHDLNYGKGKNNKGENNYKYFIQEIGIEEIGQFYHINISGWPFDGKIVCEKIEITKSGIN